MSIRGDERAVSVQIGAVLLLAILVSSMSLYQVNAVPSENEGVEIDHQATVRGELVDLRNGIVNAPNGDVGSHSVTLGTTYPSRTFFVNPPPSTGTIELNDTDREVTIENARPSNPQTNASWGNEPFTVETGSIEYSPNYNENTNAPTIVYDHSVLYNEQGGGQAPLTGQTLVDGNEITLVALEGEFSDAQSGTAALDFTTVSASETTIDLEAEENVNLSISTSLGVGAWKQVLEDEMDDGNVVDVHPALDGVTIELDDREGGYELRMAKVGLGSDVDTGDADAAYLTLVDPPEDVRVNETASMTVEVRDRYNNPVRGVEVNATDDGTAEVTTDDNETGRDGQITFEYTPESGDAGSSVAIDASFGADPSDSQLVTGTFTVSERSDGGGGELEGAFSGRIQNSAGEQVTIEGGGLYRIVDVSGDGSYTVDGVPAGTYENVVVEKDDGAVLESNEFDVSKGTRTEYVDFGDPATFNVSINGTNSPVEVGGLIEVEADVTNTGFRHDEQVIELSIVGQDGGDAETIALEGDESESATLDWNTSGVEPGEYNATVSSDDTTDSTSVEVEEPTEEATFQVSGFDGPERASPGSTISVEATVENAGNQTATKAVAYVFDGDEEGSQRLELDPDETTVIEFEHTIPEDTQPGNYTHLIRSPDDSDGDTIAIPGGPFFEITELNAPEQAEQGETVTITWTIENTGTEMGAQSVESVLFGDDQISPDVELELDPGESETVDAPYDVPDDMEPGVYEHEITTADDTETATTEVLEPASFEVDLTGTDAPVAEGETLFTTAVITNTGGVDDTQEITLEVDGEGEVDAEPVTLGPTEEEAVPLSWETQPGDVGDRTVTVSSDDDSQSRSVTVEADIELDSAIVDQGQTDSVARYEVSYNVTNRDYFDNVTVTFENLDNNWASDTYESTDPRNNIDDYGWERETGGTGGDTYEITIEAFDTAGNVVDSRTVTDDADGTDPSGNDDLSEPDSPTLESSTLRDLDSDNVEYELEYEVSDPAGKFTETEVLFMNTDSHQATGQETGTALSEIVSYSGYNSGDGYSVVVQVQDEDGIVVDREVVNDTADGDDPDPQRLQPTDVRESGDRIVFRTEHTGDERVTIEQFAVDSTDVGTTIEIDDGNAEELEIRRTDRSGIANRNGNPDSYSADGTFYDLVEDSNQGNDREYAAVEPQDEIEVDFRYFSQDLGPLESTASKAEADVIVTLVLGDGSEQEFFFQA